MAKTEKYGLPYPEDSDVANIPLDIKKLAEETEKSLIALIDLIFPIGSVFIDESVDENGNSTDYSNRFGFTWERTLQGVMPIGINPNDTDFAEIGNTGGSKTHTQTVDEMPSHTHTQNAHTHTQNSHAHNVTMNFGPSTSSTTNVYGGNANIKDYSGRTFATAGATATNQATTATNQNTGGGQAMNIMNPYKVVAYWKRVDPNAKKTISFTIGTFTYIAEEGMTWAEWVDSDYPVQSAALGSTDWSDPYISDDKIYSYNASRLLHRGCNT